MKPFAKSLTLLTSLLLASPLATALSPDEVYRNLEAAQNRVIQILNEQEPLETRLQEQRKIIRAQQAAIAPSMEKVAAARAERDQAAAEAASQPSAEATTRQQNATFRLAIAEREYNEAYDRIEQLETALRADEQRLQNNQRNLQKSLTEIKALQPELNRLNNEFRQQSQRQQQQQSAQQTANSELERTRQQLQQSENEKQALSARLKTLEAELEKARQSQATAVAVTTPTVQPAAASAPQPQQTSSKPQVVAVPAAATKAMADNDVQTIWQSLQQRLQQRNLQAAVTPSGRSLYLQQQSDRRARALPWLVVDRDTYTLETPVTAGSIEVVYGNQRETLAIPAADEGATYVFILNRVNSSKPELQYFNRAAVH